MARKRTRPKHATHLLPHEYGAACAWFENLPVPDADYQKRLVERLAVAASAKKSTHETKGATP